MAFKSLCLVLCLTLYTMEAHGYMDYVAYKRAVNFFQAWQQCRLFGGHLASIESAAENTRAEDAIMAVGDFSKDWLIGGTDLGSEGNFVWIGLNKKTTYTNFYKGEPNNNKGVENCLVMGVASSRQWNDVACDYVSGGFVCAFVRQ
ncbi:perlucin-like protein [Anopheles moucheti]|uniref:perlucin-like protein n=1 Tax=Anopheles moucheti TaxID=186751 RepID=UPI0022F0D79E|nr:perlucin-like protein [Anopheles moucheti]XP_052890424.1 perlucin-like protein [Anopheles moucheti]